MEIVVNGQSRELPDGCRVPDMLEALGLGRAACAVEINRALVRKADHAGTTLTPGDRVEIVTLVGGG
ncbi:MAG: thiamine biosynthesis protein ThiS [Planctomyces sp.]|nr:thiamine biosynthesis protein ThiS [Planctomyces sp.]MBA4038796.1 thiamine biosynthesis protein ThiS [Planctomyces sp.]